MPKRYRKQRRRRRYRRRRKSAKSLALLALRRIGKPEIKWNNVTSTGPYDTIDYNGSWYDLDAIGVGTGIGNRIGQKVFYKGVNLHLSCQLDTLNAYNYIRIFVIHWLTNDAPNMTDVLADTGSVEAPLSHFRNTVSESRYRVLYNKLVKLDTSGPQIKSIMKYVKVNRNIWFGSDTNNFPQNCRILLGAISDEVGTSNPPELLVKCRYYYTDV